MDQSKETWQNNADFTWTMYRWSCIITSMMCAPVCFIVFIIIFCVRRRTEIPLLLIPIFFLAMCICDCLRVIKEYDPDSFLFNFLASSDYFFYFMGHCMFALHYLKSSLVLPKLMEEAKLEWLMKDASRNSQKIGWDLSKL